MDDYYLNLLDTLLTKPLHYSLNHYTELKVDDYYLNLLDWSKSNILAVALRQCVFLWNASTGATQKLLETGSPVIFVFGVLNAVFLWNGSTFATHKQLAFKQETR